jgi:hypothetical protein
LGGFVARTLEVIKWHYNAKNKENTEEQTIATISTVHSGDSDCLLFSIFFL